MLNLRERAALPEADFPCFPDPSPRAGATPGSVGELELPRAIRSPILPWSACVGDGETTCSTIMSVFALTPRRIFLGTNDEIPFRYVMALLPRDHFPFPGKDVKGDMHVGGVDGMNCPARSVARTTFISGLSNRGRGRNRFGSNSGSFFGRANTGSFIVIPPGTGFPRLQSPPLPSTRP